VLHVASLTIATFDTLEAEAATRQRRLLTGDCAMAERTSLSTVQPTPEELFPTPETMELFQQAAAALEAARLVRGWRERAGLTQKELAARLRLTQARISAIEQGRGRDGPTYGLMQRLAAACNVGWPLMMPLEAGAPAAKPG